MKQKQFNSVVVVLMAKRNTVPKIYKAHLISKL